MSIETIKMLKYRDISVVIPAYNEEENLKAIVSDTVKALKDWTSSFEIIIVDDGSTDNTYALAQELSSQGPIKVLRHPKNMGSGKAILTGFAQASCRLLTYIGADGQFSPYELKIFFPLMDEVDIIVAYRSGRDNYSVYRLFNSWVYLFLIRILFKVSVRDINWVHMYRREALKDINIHSSGVFMLGEALIKAQKRGFRIAEVKTSYYPRRAGKAKCAHPKVALKALLEIIKLWWRLILGREKI